MSFSAPDVMSPKTISSATRPPMIPAIWSISSSREMRHLSSSGRLIFQTSANPPARLVARVSVVQRAAALAVRAVQGGVRVDAARSEQGGVEHVRPVRRRDDEPVGVRVEAVHLDEQLVQGLLALVVAAAKPGATLASDGVDLIDEDDAGRVLLGLVEQVAYAARADADEHLDQLRTGDREERHAGFSSHGLAQQGLAGTGRSDEQDALWNAGSKGDELFRIFQELDDLGQLLFCLFNTRHIGTSDRGVVACDRARARPAEGDRLVVTALGLA